MLKYIIPFVASAVISFYFTLFVAGVITGFYMTEVW